MVRLRVLFDNRSSLGIQNEPVSVRSFLAEVEHVVWRAGDRIGLATADSAEVPIVFDEAEDGRLIRDGVIERSPGRSRQRA